jgi:aminotransferase
MDTTRDLPLAERTAHLQQSNIRAVTDQVDAVEGINLGQGICDLPTPERIKQRTQQAVEDDRSIYSHYAGIESLRAGILEKVQSYNGLPASSIDEVMVSVGATGAFTTALMALLDPGDEVILFEPFYGYHRKLLQLVGASIRYVTTRGPDWAIDFDAVEDAITPRTKAIVVNTPGNPSGKVWSRDELDTLVGLMHQYDVVALTDEIYEYMLYEGREHLSLASRPGAYERTVTISGFSKTYNMTGWRLGYAVAPPPLIDAMGLVNDLMYICAPRPLQHGVAAAFDLDDGYLTQLQADYAARRELMCTTLERIGFEVPWPEGAYYVLASFAPLSGTRSGFHDDKAACQTLIEEAGIGTVTGRSFYHDPTDGQHRLRFCFAKELPVLEEACDRLRTAFE